MNIPLNIPARLFKIIHWPLCRTYSKYLGDKPARPLYTILCSFYFRHIHGFWPKFNNPQRFTEKLWYRMLYDRDPILTLISDKLRVRDYVDSKAGKEYLIPLLWSGDNPEEIPFDDLPSKFVIKANHGCGYNIIVNNKDLLNREMTTHRLKKWLGENFCQDKYLGIEWGYKNIKPTIVIESFIGENDKPPLDYKFYCFSGKVEILTMHFDRFGEHKNAKAFNRDFEPYKFRSDFQQYEGQVERPSNFDDMINLAESLAVDFDFIRVDLYNQNNNIYFGELTPYPAGVSSLRGFDVASLDDVLGEKWKMNGV